MRAQPLTPNTLTLRFKLHKTTVLLAATATTPFAAIKTELLAALKLTNPSGTLPTASAGTSGTSASANTAPRGVRIPDLEADVLLARPHDPLDPSLGWVRMYTSAEEAERDAAGADADDETVAAAPAADTDVQVCETPKAAGLRDGAVLAFKFRGARRAAARDQEDEDMVDEGVDVDEDAAADGDGAEGDGWDVVLPSFEDSTGVVNEGDLGVVKNYTG